MTGKYYYETVRGSQYEIREKGKGRTWPAMATCTEVITAEKIVKALNKGNENARA